LNDFNADKFRGRIRKEEEERGENIGRRGIERSFDKSWSPPFLPLPPTTPYPLVNPPSTKVHFQFLPCIVATLHSIKHQLAQGSCGFTVITILICRL